MLGGKNIMKYEIPSIEVEMLELENVICTSPTTDTTPIKPGYGDGDEDFG